MRRPALLLLFLSFLTFFLGLGRPAIGDSDEAYYAESAREMVTHGDWLTPRYNYEYRWQKPVLYYWLTAVTYSATGPSELAARLWSALCGLALVFLTSTAGRHITGRDDVGWLAGAVAATCFGSFAMARAALPDLPLAFFVTLTIWAAFTQRWPLAGVAAGLGLLTKGPVAVVLPVIVFAPVWYLERRTLIVKGKDLVASAIILAIVGLPWYIAMWATHGNEYLHSFFVGDNLERFATDRFNEPRSVLFYVPIVIGGLLPWSPYLLLWIAPIREVVRRRRRLTAPEWRLVLWAVVPLLFYTISVGKQPRYILPVLPPLAILLARSIVRSAESGRGLRVPTAVTAVLVGLLAVLLVRTRVIAINASPAATWMAVAGLAAVAIALAHAAFSHPERRVIILMPSCAAVTLVALQFGALSGVRPEPVERMAALVVRHRSADERVGEYQVFVRNLVFYTRFKQQELFDEAHALDFIRSADRVLLVVRDVDLARLESIARVSMNRLGEVQYVNSANLKLPTLLRPIREQDVQTVVLASNR